MRKRNLLVFAVLTAAMLVAGSAFAGPDFDRANGGGQVLNLVDDGDGGEVDQPKGPGDTIAFSVNNQRGEEFPRGQVQYVDRTVDPQGKKTSQDVYHYNTITCFEVTGTPGEGEKGGVAVIVATRGTGSNAEWIQLQATDGGPHDDTIFISRGATDAPTSCAADGDRNELALARGNVTVYDSPDA